ncbi:MAG: 3-methyl-2-oxobutanoate hydroxymethyltransferase [Elusimicrobia bacterium]|nr:3-methyl-2-oxobutanoate hydroxymethyltransferase [Elusimicrobiota bacterium]
MERNTILTLQSKKKTKSPIVALTCYDAASARLIDEIGVDVALVGDSLANTRLGYPNTLPVTLDEMIHHTKAASRGIRQSLLVADMPFQSYEYAPWMAAQAAGRFVKEAGAQAVKVEGGERVIVSVRAILNANVPVMGHLGLTPQSFHQQGGYRVQGRTMKAAAQLLKEAKLLENTGVFALVLEGVPESLANRVTKALKIPTIGIGAGAGCDGQILVLDDVLGFSEGPSPKFVAAYAQVRPLMKAALKRFSADVRARRFPSARHSYH